MEETRNVEEPFYKKILLGFVFQVEHDRDYEEESKDNGTLLKWTIAEIISADEVEINYTLKGEGDDYSLKNMEAKAFK